jgi:7-cyano-7-deazaguanine synthase
MENKQKQKYAVISLSGGMDSSTLLLRLLNEGYQCTALSFDYGQKHKIELQCATDLVEYVNQNNFFPNHLINAFPPVKHQIIKLDGLAQLLNSTLVEGGAEVPEGHYAQENMKDTVVPNRNKIFSSIIQAVALSIADKNETECVMALGIHSGDHAIYPDCTENFRQADLNAFKVGNWNSERVDFYAPYMETDKAGILKDGEACCKQLGLDFNEVYKRTNTSYKPLKIVKFDKRFEGTEDEIRVLSEVWYSDYKSASSVERIEAFLSIGRKDPVNYAEVIPNGEIIPRTWDEVLVHVKPILTNHKK